MLGPITVVGLLAAAMVWSPKVSAKETVVTTRKTQTVDFTGDTVDGTARHPDAAYLVQKRSVDFVPLYKVRERFDQDIRSSVNYLK